MHMDQGRTSDQAVFANTDSRLNALDGLRAISILLVLSAHMLPLGPKNLTLNSTAGSMGMSLFFVLSGFLITSTLMKNGDVLDFLVRRCARIAPLAYAYALIAFTLVYFDPQKALWTMSFVENYFDDHLGGANAHLWSLCVEMQFYLAIALVVLSGGKRALWIVWPACLAITALRINQGAYVHIQTHLRVDEILSGACVATLYPSIMKRRAGTILLVLASILWVASSRPDTEFVQYLRPYATALMLAGVLIPANSRSVQWLGSSPMRYIATISYALYIIHPITIDGWWNQGAPLEKYLLKRPVSFALTFIAAHLSTFYWERFWQTAARNWLARRRNERRRSMGFAS
jgi:peptidoglycan/LPS O-acetylase OafA/YrhL